MLTVTIVGANILNLNHLTDQELINQQTLREDLSLLEHELLDRLIRATDALKDMEMDLDLLHRQAEDALTDLEGVVSGHNA